MELSVGELFASAADRPLEIVERKGIGHPDTICDALAEALGVALSRRYLAATGAIQHHNVDKALLRGGAARAAYRGGEVLEPIEIYLAGRATADVGGTVVPVASLCEQTARAWLAAHLHGLDPERHVAVRCLVRPGSADLVELFARQRRAGRPLANDTSIGAGYAPLSDLERAVLAASRALERAAGDPSSPEIGEDTKVMGVRQGERLRLTVACAFLGGHIDDVAHYVACRERVRELALAAAREATPRPVEVDVNVGDDPAAGEVFLTVTGTSAEAGDDGQVGRGNRVNGLITPCRPMTLEAAAGKNPVTHVGKLYNVVAHRIAAAIVAAVPDVAEAQCLLVSQIGRPIDEPQAVDVRLSARRSAPASLRSAVEPIVTRELAGLPALAGEILAGRVALF
jgi:S-adenosylmethionine synthetase